MRKALLFLFIFFLSANGFCSTYLPGKYLIPFGDHGAPVKITEYFSFFCPHCVATFRKDFSTIKETYLDKGEVYLVFHPMPMDLATVQAMDCLEKLDDQKKRLFLESLMEEIDLSDVDVCTKMMVKAMEILGNPIPDLSEENYLTKTDAYNDSFAFITNDEKPEAIPSVSVNGKFFPDEIPSKDFIQSCVEKHKNKRGKT